jgi:hypothetical protein
LDECAKSLASQRRTSKVIVFTATPCSYIEDVAAKYGFEYFVGTSRGIGGNWNEALSFVKTKYATIAHQDDIYVSSYADKVMCAFEREADALIAFTDYNELRDDEVTCSRGRNLEIKSKLLKPIKWFPRSRFVRGRMLGLGNIICCPAVSYNLEKLAGFRFVEDMKTNLDWEAWYRISRMRGAFVFVPEILMYHRIHEESETSATIADNTRTREDLEMYERYWPRFVARALMRFYVKGQDSN